MLQVNKFFGAGGVKSPLGESTTSSLAGEGDDYDCIDGVSIEAFSIGKLHLSVWEQR